MADSCRSEVQPRLLGLSRKTIYTLGNEASCASSRANEPDQKKEATPSSWVYIPLRGSSLRAPGRLAGPEVGAFH